MILENSVNKFVTSSDTIKNAFRACGIYTWNPDAVNYSKFLGVSATKNALTPVRSSIDRKSISFEEFKNLVGQDLHKKLELVKSEERLNNTKSNEFLSLLKFFEDC